LPATVSYVTSPGERVVSVVTDRGVLRRDNGVLRLAAVPAGDGTVYERVRAFVASCGYEPEVAREVEDLDAIGPDEVRALREFDRQRIFLA
jgi:acyl CoA:acetate/3-ketoacid CoA transferase beta subunit